MPPLSAKQKQALSGLAVMVAGAVLTWANASLHLLPEGWQGLVGAVLAGVAHYLPALGTADVIEDKALSKAITMTTEAVSRET